VLRLARLAHLLAVDGPLALDQRLVHLLTPHRHGRRGGDVHRDVAHQLLEGVVARHEVGLAVHLHQHADLATHVDVAADRALARLARSALGRLRRALGTQDVDRRLHVAVRLLQRPLHSIIPAPVRSRSSLTSFAVIAIPSRR
jgi:hypothetical protein